MKRSPKQRGTEAEVMARNFLADDGWTDCERIVQHGAHDQARPLAVQTQPAGGHRHEYSAREDSQQYKDYS